MPPVRLRQLFVPLEQQLGCKCIARMISYAVIAGLDPAIHAAVRKSLTDAVALGESAWTTGSSPVVTKRERRALL